MYRGGARWLDLIIILNTFQSEIFSPSNSKIDTTNDTCCKSRQLDRNDDSDDDGLNDLCLGNIGGTM